MDKAEKTHGHVAQAHHDDLEHRHDDSGCQEFRWQKRPDAPDFSPSDGSFLQQSLTSAATDHAAHAHHDNAEHHHHTHAAAGTHEGGHHLLQVDDLSIGFSMYENRSLAARKRMSNVIEHLNVSVHVGEVLALVGASGSGKSLLADAIMGLFAENAQVTGRIWFDGHEQDVQSMRAIRGREIAFIPQSVQALDPLQRVGAQIERLGRNIGLTKAGARERRRELFARYRLEEGAARKYPFELSGGMARRVLLIAALMGSPRLIVADEPTPGLDLELAVQAMADLRAFADEGGGVLLITHDIELALRVADRVAVFNEGTVVEETAVESFEKPGMLRHPYSQQLRQALWGAPMALRPPEQAAAAAKSDGRLGPQSSFAYEVRDASLSNQSVSSDSSSLASRRPAEQKGVSVPRALEARDITFAYPGAAPVLSDVSLDVVPGERVALSAPSGFGKSTLCQILAGYLAPSEGSVSVDGASLPKRGVCPVQMIWQHPERVLNPRIRIEASLREVGEVPRELLDALGVCDEWRDRYPLELSGGQLQRICIARALATRPRYLICDETTTMLDPITQAQVWQVLVDWANANGAGMVLVTHSEALANRIATRTVNLAHS